MKVNFFLARPDAKNETAIVVRISHNKNDFRYCFGVSCLPRYWNAKEHKVKQSPSYRQYAAINATLENVKGEINDRYYDYKRNNAGKEPSPAVMKNIINEALNKKKKVRLSLFEYYTDFIERTRSGLRTTAKAKLISPDKARTHTVTLNKLKEYSQDEKKDLDFDTIDLIFYKDFTTWLRKKGYTENYVGGHIKNLKAVLNEATQTGQNTNLAFRLDSFTKPSEEVDNIALTDVELKEIRNLDLSGMPHLDRVRDLFLIGCYTGLRFSDFTRLTPENVKGGFIEITQSKTGDPVVIPVHSVVRSIFEKYGGNLPESISNQKFNGYLKEVCKRVPCLKESASKTRTQGGMKVTVNRAKWEMIGSHTARRSFATNAYLQGIPTITIIAVTGHKTEKAFLKYIKITPKEHAKIMAKYWSRSKMKAV